ncbi:MAG: peptidylprolyl isomerase [Candidatus Komeilibacteria bacterium]|nr:peptidylprolyl isomerase [Candidatus Komeilibacteria bacterium]
MKKYILFAAVLIILAGCGVNTTDKTEVSNTANKKNSNIPIMQTPPTNTNQLVRPEDQPVLHDKYSGAIIKTNRGDIEVEFYNEKSPLTVNNFLYLSQAGFYDNTKFHRVIKDFMIQGGDPNSKGDNPAIYGRGGPGYSFFDELNDEKLVEGSLAMANAGPGTNGSQFFIVTAESTPWLDGLHTNFGKVIKGMEVVTAIEQSKTGAGDLPADPIIITDIELVE